MTFSSWWFQPTHLKNMQPSNWIISPGFRVKIKNVWNPHLVVFFSHFQHWSSWKEDEGIKVILAFGLKSTFLFQMYNIDVLNGIFPISTGVFVNIYMGFIHVHISATYSDRSDQSNPYTFLLTNLLQFHLHFLLGQITCSIKTKDFDASILLGLPVSKCMHCHCMISSVSHTNYTCIFATTYIYMHIYDLYYRIDWIWCIHFSRSRS